MTEPPASALNLVRRPGAFPVDLEADAGLVGLLDFGADPLDEPFLAWTAERLLSHAGQQRSGWVTIDALREATRDSPPPAGVLCHVGRCGSTLLCNMLGRLGFRVIRESPVVAGAFDALAGDTSDSAARPRLELEQQRTILGSYCRGANGEFPPTILKLASTDTRLLPALRLLWPDSAIVCMRRDLYEVVASNLIGRPGWLLDAVNPETAEQSLVGRLSTLGHEPRERRREPTVLLTHLQHAIRATMAEAPQEVRLDVDFQNLVDAPQHTLTAVVEHLGLGDLLRPDAVATALLERRVYAKGRRGHGVDQPGGDPVTRHRLTPEEQTRVATTLDVLAKLSERPHFSGLPVYRR